MINPVDFHKTAELLKDQQDEWHIRTTVNRCYYGVFLYFRDFFTEQGVRIPEHKDKSQHKFVIECFQKSKAAATKKMQSSGKNGDFKEECIKIGQIYSRLKTLLQDRTNADYRLDLRFPPSYSEDSLRRAKTTIEDFDKLDKSVSIIIKTAESHARIVNLAAIKN